MTCPNKNSYFTKSFSYYLKPFNGYATKRKKNAGLCYYRLLSRALFLADRVGTSLFPARQSAYKKTVYRLV